MSNYSKYLNSNSTNEIFPARFSNEIYFSDCSSVDFKYESVYSIKYQISGIERYKLGTEFVEIKPQQYFIVNDKCEVFCLPSKSEKAISLFIEPELLTDVFKNIKSSHDELMSNPFDPKSDLPVFFERPFYLQKNKLSNLLQSLGKNFNNGISGQLKFNIEFFFDTAEALLISQQETLRQIKAIKGTKPSTKKELYKRILIVVDYIQSNWKNKISVFDLASVAALSPYHFHRVFKSIYNETPSRFIRNIRLENAKELLKSDELTISDAAELVGYEDIFSFSKAFKKKFGTAPSNFRIQ